jgi:IS605 OrfB family transposase
LNSKKDRYEKQLIQLTNKVTGVCFGSKKLARGRLTQKTYYAQPERWQKDWEAARYGKMTISGRKDAKSGNFVFHYRPETHTLTFKAINQCVIRLSDVVFPYGQDHVNHAIQTQMNLKDKKKYGKPIGWSLEDHGDYYIVKCLIDVPPAPYLNTSTSTGMVGVDLNVNHIAVANVNDIGQCVDAFTLPFNLEGKTSGQQTKIIEAEVIALVDYAVKHHKPLAIEKLDTTRSKVSRPYGHKKGNRRMSQFAYQKMILAIKSRAEKMGVAVYIVNPAYTSQIGKMKYMKRLGVSIHMAAAYVIARRAMGFNEKLPPMLYPLVPEQKQGLHHWAGWAYMTRTLSFVRTHAFYQTERFDQSKLCSWNALFPQHALTDVEKIGLRRLESRKTYA